MEQWKDIDGFDGKYQISNLGNVRSFSKWKNGGLLKKGKTTTGYYVVNLVVDGRRKIVKKVIHRLVATHFLENPNNYSEVNHKDGNKLNNNVDNLEWVSRSGNMRHAYEHGLIPRRFGKLRSNAKTVIQKNKNGDIVKIWGSVADIHRETGYSTNSIVCCCNKKT